jgi:hypothetical protein
MGSSLFDKEEQKTLAYLFKVKNVDGKSAYMALYAFIASKWHKTPKQVQVMFRRCMAREDVAEYSYTFLIVLVPKRSQQRHPGECCRRDGHW